MRTIKFRGKRLDGQGWAYGYYAESDEYGDNGGCEHNYRETITTLYYIVDRNGKPELVLPESVGQWTGLVDRHGKEIYEGDVIKNNSGELEKIVFAQGSFKCASIKYPNANLYLLDSYAGYIEIIGNIHDNPSLLEDK